MRIVDHIGLMDDRAWDRHISRFRQILLGALIACQIICDGSLYGVVPGISVSRQAGFVRHSAGLRFILHFRYSRRDETGLVGLVPDGIIGDRLRLRVNLLKMGPDHKAFRQTVHRCAGEENGNGLCLFQSIWRCRYITDTILNGFRNLTFILFHRKLNGPGVFVNGLRIRELPMKRASVQRTVRIVFACFSHFAVMEAAGKCSVFSDGQFGAPCAHTAGELKYLSVHLCKQIHGRAFRDCGCDHHHERCHQHNQSSFHCSDLLSESL